MFEVFCKWQCSYKQAGYFRITMIHDSLALSALFGTKEASRYGSLNSVFVADELSTSFHNYLNPPLIGKKEHGSV